MNSTDYCNASFGYFTYLLGIGIVERIQQVAPKPVDITTHVQKIFQTQIPLLKEWAVESSKQFFPWLCLTAVAGTAAFYGIKFLHQKMHENLKEIGEVRNNAITSRIFDGMRSTASTSVYASNGFQHALLKGSLGKRIAKRSEMNNVSFPFRHVDSLSWLDSCSLYYIFHLQHQAY